MDIIDFGVVFLIGFVLGELYLSFRIRKILEDMIDKSIEDEEEETLVELFKLKTEINSDSILLYDEEGLFICQGKTIEELAVLAEKYSGIKYAAVMHEEKIVIFMDGVVKETI
jgi:hypothetical protein